MSKRSIFVTLGLACVVVLILIGRNSSIYAAVKDGARFEDWGVVCEKDESSSAKNKKVCYLSQSLNKDDKRVAEFKIGFFGPEKRLQMIQILPLGVNLNAGSAVLVEQEVLASGKFFACYNYGCLSVADLNADVLKKLYSKSESFVGVVIADANKQVNFKFSTKGLKKGIEALK
ncbi:MAG: hypothetical protein K0Q51_989 [Rickettsiaceae bacterium]|jgi:invasion protein IalB|nr:hypothetical protein [Rickettsiaceae bacterium]